MISHLIAQKNALLLLKFLLAWLFIAVIRLNGQPYAKLYSDVDTTSGLSNNRITTIVQDQWGLVWIGTKDGLNVYDGSLVITYSTSNSNLKSNDISKLYIDQQKRLWVGTVKGGAYFYNEKENNFEQVYQTHNKERLFQTIYGFYEDLRGNLWCASQNGLYNIAFDTSNIPFTSIAIDSYLPKDEKFTVTSFFQNDTNNLWLGTKGNGIINLNTVTNKFSKIDFKSRDKINIDFINTFQPLEGNDLLIGTNGFGVYLVNTKNFEITTVPLQKSKDVESSIIREIFVSRANTTWIATDGNGLFCRKNETERRSKLSGFRPFNDPVPLVIGKSVTAIFEDNQSNLWFGSARNGIKIKHRLPPYLRFITLEEKKRSILSIYKDTSRFYLGTDGYGLLEKGNNIQPNIINQAFEHNFIQCVVPDNKSSLWIGTFNNGVFEYSIAAQKSKKYKYSPNNSINTLSNNDVRDILIHSNGDKWVATWGGGLNKINSENRLTQVSASVASQAKNILDLETGLDNELWLATYDEGIVKFSIHDKNFTFFDSIYKVDRTLNKQSFTLLFNKNKNVLGVGTKEGLILFKPNENKFQKFKIGEDSNANEIVSLLQDDFGHLWMGTKEGIYHFDPGTHKADKIPFTSFEFHINSKYKDPQGKMYFGSVNGVVEVNPLIYFQNEITHYKEPKTIVSGIQILDSSEKPKNESIPFRKLDTTQIELPHTSNAITFYFSTLNFSEFDKVSHEIKLEGFDKQWRNVGRLNQATYTNLNPGTYIFKARQRNTVIKSVSENIGRQVFFRITPPFWKTSWAYFIEVVFVGVLFVFLRKYSLRWFEVNNKLKNEAILREKEVQLHHQKERFFANISHEMRTPLTLISGVIHALLHSRLKPENQRKIIDLRVSMERLLRLSNEILTFGKLPQRKTLHVSKNNLTRFIKEIFLTFSQQAIINEINYHFDHEKDSLFAYFDKIEFEKVIYNLLSNAFKFTENGGKIIIRLKSKKTYFQIDVSDTGQGIVSEELPYIFERFYQGNSSKEKTAKGFGIGLAIVKEVLALHGGNIEVNSQQNEGTHFFITIPKGHAHFDPAALSKDPEHQEFFLTRSNRLDSVIMEDEIKGSTILLVEDDHHIRMYIKEILMNQFSIIEAINGKQGYAKAQDEMPNLIITDIMMPEMDGVTLCYKLKNNLTTSHIPVMILSAKMMTKNILEGYEGGADDYITKPFNEDIFLIRIRNLLMSRLNLRKNFTLKDYLDAKNVHVIPSDELFFKKLFTKINENISDFKYNAKHLAKDMCMSHSALYKKIKVLTNMTLIGLIKKFKMNYAHKLLSEGGITVSETSYKIGYGDVRHFSQEFKKVHGVLPSEVKKK